MMKFTASMLGRARGLPRTATEPVVAAALDVSTATLARWRQDGSGPDYRMVRGRAVYSRNCVLAFLHRKIGGSHDGPLSRRFQGVQPSTASGARVEAAGVSGRVAARNAGPVQQSRHGHVQPWHRPGIVPCDDEKEVSTCQ